jgi:hypothetical protein
MDILVDVKGTGCEGVDGINLHQDRVNWWAFMNIVMNHGLFQF